MKRFFTRIREKGNDPAQPPVLIVAFGDSVTQGAMELGKWNAQGVYHRIVQEELEAAFPSTTFSTINAGVCGTTAQESLGRVPRDIIRHQPDLVLIAFGLNDSGKGMAGIKDFENALVETISQIRENTEADIILITPPHMASKRTGRVHADHLEIVDALIKTQNEGTLASYADTIRKVAKDYGIVLADVHAEWTRMKASGVDVDSWLCNGINHPDEEGHRLAAAVLFTTLSSERKPSS